MNTFELDPDHLRKAWGGTNQYWFSLRDYKLKDATTMSELDKPENVSQSSYLVSLGYIPYFVVTNEEVMRAYVDSLTNAKLKRALSNIDDDNYVDSFWKYFNVYPEVANGWDEFESKYVLDKAVKWCIENGIKYAIK